VRFLFDDFEGVLRTFQAAMRAQGLARYEDADLVVLETDGSFTAVPHLPDGPSAATDALRSLLTSEQ